VTRPLPYEVMTDPSPTAPDRRTYRPDKGSTATDSEPARDLIVKAQSGVWPPIEAGGLGRRRGLGPAAHHTEQGWVVPVGVSDIASRVGVIDDTAARPVAVLGTAGLVVLQRDQGKDGRRRFDYRLQLLDGVELRARPHEPDAAPPNENHSCTDPQDRRCPTSNDSRDHCPNDKDRHSPARDHRDGCPALPNSPALTETAPARTASRRQQAIETSSQVRMHGTAGQKPPSSRRSPIWPPATTSPQLTRYGRGRGSSACSRSATPAPVGEDPIAPRVTSAPPLL
jgi:hypothetical protein